MRFSALVAAIAVLAGCGDGVPRTFAEPPAELERLLKATAAECRQERKDYWFCSADNGFFHLFTVQPPGGASQVASVMLERGAAERLEREILRLYGFAREDLAQLAPDRPPVRRGGFELVLDAAWKMPAVRAAGGD